MPKALVVTTISTTIESFLLPLAAGLRARGWEVHAAAAGAADSQRIAAAFDAALDLPWTRNPLNLNGAFRAASRIMSAQADERYDIVHVHTPIAAFFGRFAVRRAREHDGLRVIYTAHGFHFFNGQSPLKYALFSTAERIAGRWTDCIVTINEEDYASARRLRLQRADDVRLIAGGVGVDIDHYSARRVTSEQVSTLRKTLHIDDGACVFVTVGELNANKRPLDVIRSFAPAAHSRGAHLLVVGTGPLGVACERLVAARGLSSHVHFLGQLDDVRTALGVSNALVQYSIHEGLPRAVMEAMCMDVPVIGSDIRGIRDLLASGGGWLVQRDSPKQLTAAMMQVLDNPAQARTRGRLGGDFARRELEVGVVTRQYCDLYEEAVSW